MKSFEFDGFQFTWDSMPFYFDSVVNQIYNEGKFAIARMNAGTSPTLRSLSRIFRRSSRKNEQSLHALSVFIGLKIMLAPIFWLYRILQEATLD